MGLQLFAIYSPEKEKLHWFAQSALMRGMLLSFRVQ
jgi:hypothetical protein